MRKFTRLLAVAAILFGALGLAAPSYGATTDDCASVTVTGRVSGDSGVKGNDWATTTLNRKTVVCVKAKPETGDWTLTADVTDRGTFKTLPGWSPNGTATLKGGFKGDVVGEFHATFSAPKWDGSLVKPSPSTKTSDWVAAVFPGAKFDGSPTDRYKWTYTTCAGKGETHVQTDAANTGDITERACATASASPTPTAKPSTSPKASASAVASLPVTGDRTNVPAVAGGALAAVVVGVVLLVWARRRSES
jgi:LPXTG-motif cell wall-anchored protein